MIKEKIFLFFIKSIVLILTIIIFGIFGYLFYNGIKVINLDFIFSMPRNFMREGGIYFPL